jgi:hypothetical protein
MQDKLEAVRAPALATSHAASASMSWMVETELPPSTARRQLMP